MNLLLFSNSDRIDGKRIRIAHERLHHLRTVIDAKTGDRVRVGEVDGRVGTAQVASLDKDEAVLEVTLDSEPPPKLPVTLVLALPRPKMLRRILRTVAEYGVPELYLVNSYRVEKSYWQTPALEADTMTAYFLQGLSQARDTVLPQVHLRRGFKPFVEDELPGLIAGRRALLAHPGDHPACPRDVGQPSLLLIGPEGGFIPYEVDKLQSAGCATVTLGPRILRVENAVSTLLGKLY